MGKSFGLVKFSVTIHKYFHNGYSFYHIFLMDGHICKPAYNAIMAPNKKRAK